jgi:anaerobic ribonucleoside-triphosphate reductase activating protein
MRSAGLMQDSIVDGPGLRFVVFTQGCPHRCAGCHNPDTHDPEGGREMPVSEVVRQMLSNPLTDGVTLTGGEPFFQAAACAEIAPGRQGSRSQCLDVFRLDIR